MKISTEVQKSGGNNLPGRHDGAVGATQQTRSAIRMIETQCGPLSSRAEQQLAALLDYDPKLAASLKTLAQQDKQSLEALAAFLDPKVSLIAGMGNVVDSLKKNGATEAQARHQIAKEIIEDGMGRGDRVQGTRALCVEAQFVRNYFNASQYAKTIAELAVTGETKLASGARLQAPDRWSHFRETNSYYGVQNAGEDLIMCSVRLVTSVNAPEYDQNAFERASAEEIDGNFAFAARDKLDLVTGKEHFVAWGKLATLYAIAQRESHPEYGTPEMSVRWAGKEDGLNHCVGISELRGNRVVVSNTWGDPKRKDDAKAPPSLRQFKGGEHGLQSLSLEDLSDRTNWALIDNRMATIKITDDMLKKAGIRDANELQQLVDEFRAQGATNVSLGKKGDQLCLAVDTSTDGKDLSMTDDIITGFDLNLLYASIIKKNTEEALIATAARVSEKGGPKPLAEIKDAASIHPQRSLERKSQEELTELSAKEASRIFERFKS